MDLGGLANCDSLPLALLVEEEQEDEAENTGCHHRDEDTQDRTDTGEVGRGILAVENCRSQSLFPLNRWTRGTASSLISMTHAKDR